VFGGGNDGTYSNIMDYINISSAGDAVDFGDLTFARQSLSACSNGTSDRGVFGGGYNISGGSQDILDYITISSTGDATDFGDLTVTRSVSSSMSNLTNNRGIFSGATTSNTIDYITISSTGNAADFGDLVAERSRSDSMGATSDGTNNRGLFAGGNNNENIIEYITISTTGNSTDFGNLTVARRFIVGMSDAS
jgi:hypothetical protein